MGWMFLNRRFSTAPDIVVIPNAAALREADESTLLPALRAGDELAFQGLTDRYHRELLVHCYRMLGSFHDAEDVLQETLLRAWRGLESFEGRSAPVAFSVGVADCGPCRGLRGRWHARSKEREC